MAHEITCDIAPSEEEVAERAARLIASSARQTVRTLGKCVISLTGGTTPVLCYRALTRLDLPWGDMHFLQTDQRVGAVGKNSTWNIITSSLLDPAGVPTENRHPILIEDDLGRSASQYAQVISTLCNNGTPDVVLLSIGEDGHTASLFDDDPAVYSEKPVAVTGSHNGSVRLTMTPTILSAVRWRILMAVGSSKAQAVRKLVGVEASSLQIPAWRVLHSGGMLLADKAAFSLAMREPRTS